MSKTAALQWGSLLLIGVLGGCASLADRLPPEEYVGMRAQEWADALIAGDMETAMGFTSPNYREWATQSHYNSVMAGVPRWTSAQVESVACEEEVCDVVVQVEYHVKRWDVVGSRPLDYKWIKLGGEWWLRVAPR